MRVLLLTQVVPYPPDSGPRVKTWHTLRYLASRHEVTLVSFVRSPAEVEAAQRLRQHCRAVHTVPLARSRARDVAAFARSLASGRPFLVERDDLPAMRATIHALLAAEHYEVLHADQLSMGQYAEPVAHAGGPLCVLDAHNAVWSVVQRAARWMPWGPRRLAAEREWRLLRRYEGWLCRRLDHVLAVSEEDRRALALAAGSDERIAVVPIAVDTEQLAYRPAAGRDILSLATMFYPPNADGVRWFIHQVLPRVQEHLPGSRFLVVGSRPPPDIQRLGRPERGVEVLGYVADLEPVLARAGVLVVPLWVGGGVRVKILEAFARGLPVVSTTIGAEGIAARPGRDLLIADDARSFAEAVVRVLSEPALAQRLAAAARALVEQQYDWRTALGGLDEIYLPRVLNPQVVRGEVRG